MLLLVENLEQLSQYVLIAFLKIKFYMRLLSMVLSACFNSDQCINKIMSILQEYKENERLWIHVVKVTNCEWVEQKQL